MARTDEPEPFRRAREQAMRVDVELQKKMADSVGLRMEGTSLAVVEARSDLAAAERDHALVGDLFAKIKDQAPHDLTVDDLKNLRLYCPEAYEEAMKDLHEGDA
jgi:hypothetical protein